MLRIRKAALFDLSSTYSEAVAGGVQYGHIPSPPACLGDAAHRGVPCLAAGPSTLLATPPLGSDGSCCSRAQHAVAACSRSAPQEARGVGTLAQGSAMPAAWP